MSLDRISKFLTAEELAEPYQLDQTLPLAVQVDGDFTWETVLGVEEDKSKIKENLNDDKGTSGQDTKKRTDKTIPKDEVKSRWWKSKETSAQDRLPSTTNDSKIASDGNNDSTEKEKNTDSTEKQQEPPFSLSNLRFEVPKGAFVAIVGPVGCGKVSQKVTYS